MYGKSENREDYQDTPRTVAAMARDLPDQHVIPTHTHRRGQLVYGSSGAITVTTPAGTWVVPPHRAVWVPPRVPHAMRTSGAVPMRTLYIEPDAREELPPACTVVAVTPLLRELISAATHIPIEYDEHGRDGKIMALLLEEFRPQATIPLHLPLPSSLSLVELCQRVIADPGHDWTIAEAAAHTHQSPRNLSRRFQAELGYSFARWRQQARLLAAVEHLAHGDSVAQIAVALSYDSPSAFSAMFRKALGAAPTHYFSA